VEKQEAKTELGLVVVEGDDEGEAVAIEAYVITYTNGVQRMVWTDETPDQVATRYADEAGKARGGVHRLMRFPPILSLAQKKARKAGEEVDLTPAPLTEFIPKVVGNRVKWDECPTCSVGAGVQCVGLPAGTPADQVHDERPPVEVEVERPIVFVRVDLIADISSEQHEVGDDEDDEDEGDEAGEDPPERAVAEPTPEAAAPTAAPRSRLPAGFAVPK
jgi:hypothetical protein